LSTRHNLKLTDLGKRAFHSDNTQAPFGSENVVPVPSSASRALRRRHVHASRRSATIKNARSSCAASAEASRGQEELADPHAKPHLSHALRTRDIQNVHMPMPPNTSHSCKQQRYDPPAAVGVVPKKS
jgi:hypothetical protein